MKIFFVGESYVPQKCGMTTVTKYLAEGLAQQGHHVTIATCWYDNQTPKHDFINGVEIFRFHLFLDIFKRPRGQILDFLEFVINFKSDVLVVECFGSVTSNILFPHLDEIKVPKILHSHGDPFKSLRPFAIKHDLKHTIGNTYNYFRLLKQRNGFFPDGIKKFDKIALLSEVASDIEIVQKSAKDFVVMENACEDMFFDAYHSDEKSSYDLLLKNDQYIISIANYTPIKNQLEMVEAYFESNIKNVSLVLIGSSKNAYSEKVEKCVQKHLNDENGKEVKILYGVDRKELPNILKNASLYLITSTFEEYSISIVEAMSLGIPFVSTNAGNARILPGGVTVYNHRELVSQINRLMNDKVLREEYGNKGKKYADKHCRIGIAVNKFEKIIKESIY